MLANIAFVLIGTTHPGNIGATARATKNMCLEELRLVQPKEYPSAEATARASGADDLLARVEVYNDLDSAVADCSTVFGTSARTRNIPWPVFTPREAAAELWRGAQGGKAALLFGREKSGLTNTELDRCSHLIHIPSNDDYNSLNLAAAAQLLAYEIYLAALGEKAQSIDQSSEPAATAEEMRQFYVHLEQAMVDIGFLDPGNPKQLMRRLQRLFNRARLERMEVNILRGLLNAARKGAQNVPSSS